MRDRQHGRAAAPKVVRCAIYTRKSTEEGLEQEFNSLDAQREACAAYILSQRHEGWTLVTRPSMTMAASRAAIMDRPALKAAPGGDVAAGKIDVIVVYKVDRLTRSLARTSPRSSTCWKLPSTSFVSRSPRRSTLPPAWGG